MKVVDIGWRWMVKRNQIKCGVIALFVLSAFQNDPEVSLPYVFAQFPTGLPRLLP